jgi:hypothetical protein
MIAKIKAWPKSTNFVSFSSDFRHFKALAVSTGVGVVHFQAGGRSLYFG